MSDQAVQLDLFAPPAGTPTPHLTTPEELSPDSTLDVARWWWSAHLQHEGRPPNTIYAYTNDLSVLHAQVGQKPLRRIDARDIGAFLDAANRKSTRKRRLTSVRELYAFLIGERRVLSVDPTERYFPERIHLKTPVPLFAADRERLLDAATRDGDRALLMVRLMLHLGINRTELLALRKEHFDLSDADDPVVYVQYDDPRWRHKDRRLRGDAAFAEVLARFLPALPDDRLFPMRPQAVNAIVNRLVRDAKLERIVTPQTLRDTFGVDQARAGRDEDELLAVLGLASDPRNRDSVRRYIKLAQPAHEVGGERDEGQETETHSAS